LRFPSEQAGDSGVSWLLVWLGLGQRFLNFNHPLLKFGCEVSYPLYLLHLLVWIPGVLLIGQIQIDALPSSLVLTALVLGGTLALTVLLKRWRFVGMLLGLKGEPARTTPFATARSTFQSTPNSLFGNAPIDSFTSA
jgi:peptidoglycan/LPS O-acetylase OafA/YrhL